MTCLYGGAALKWLRRQKMDSVQFTVNGQKCVVNAQYPRDLSLNMYLRYSAALTGTKAMCRDGGCGACVVAVRHKGATFSVNSCLVLVFSCHGWDITTVEGDGNRRDGYSEIQKRFVGFNATQCGYCTPGWVMQLHSLQDKHMTMAELERAFGSNTCRCTGYRPIMDVVKSFAVDASPELCQKVQDIEELKVCATDKSNCKRKCSLRSEGSDWSRLSSDFEHLSVQNMISLDFGKYKFFKVYEEDQIFDVLNKQGYDSYMLVSGNTGKGIYETSEYPSVLVDISSVSELKGYRMDQNLVLGANTTLQDALVLFKDLAKADTSFAYLEEFSKHFDLIAHLPVRYIGSIAGNLVLRHKIPTYQSDVFVLFAAVGAYVTMRDKTGKKQTLSMSQFLQADLAGQLLTSVELPPLSSSHVFRSYKIMPRNQNALAIVNAAFLLKLDSQSRVQEASIAYGNLGSNFIRANKTQQQLIGKNLFTDAGLQEAVRALDEELRPQELPLQPPPAARKQLALGLFYKFILNICPVGLIKPTYRSGGQLIQRPVSKGSQDFQADPSLFPLNQPAAKLEASIQSAGEAQYANDTPNLPRQVFAAFVLSDVCRAEVELVDGADVLKIEGVLCVLTAKDIPGKNSFTRVGYQLLTEDEEIMASKKVLYYGQPVALVVATSEQLAADVAKKVKVKYRNISSAAPVLTVDAANKDPKRVNPSKYKITPTDKGDDVKHVIKGKYDVGAQYHYYMEPISCVAAPVDRGLEVYSSSQWMDANQTAIADALGFNGSNVIVKVRRLGGGFGGKISRTGQVAAACALVAHKLDVPCRLVLPMQTNTVIAGRRPACSTEYEVGVNDSGRIQYLKAHLSEDSGCSLNDSVMEYILGGFTNCYDTARFQLDLQNVLTDTSSTTFARAPGNFEGIATIEHIMDHIAFVLHKDSTDVRLENMRKDDNDLPQLIKDLKKDADYDARHQAARLFNQSNRWMKKAISISVMSFNVEYYGNYHALVSIYRTDGTVTVTTGGVEMGQGLNTKAAQVCAYKLGIPLDQVSVIPNYSFVAANDAFSGSSITSESVCFSIIKACDTLLKRLEPVRKELGNPTWKDLIAKAGEELIELTASYMMTDKEKELQGYSAFAVTILEVQLDVLTGRFELLRADILEDVGLSANPAIDVGQVEGGYIQGLGCFTLEKMVFSPDTGKLLTNRSLTYHVPLALDIPADLRVKLRYNSKNPKGVLGSKAVGEMGACTSYGVTHALRRCINASRYEGKHDLDWIYIDVPYDTESILKALDVKPKEFLISK